MLLLFCLLLTRKMFTWKLFLVFSICIGISQSQYYYDGNEDYGDDYREREKISFKTVPSKFYFQTVFFLNCSCRFLHPNYLFKLASLLLKFIKTENPLLANKKSILLENIYLPIRIIFSGSKKVFFFSR